MPTRTIWKPGTNKHTFRVFPRDGFLRGDSTVKNVPLVVAGAGLVETGVMAAGAGVAAGAEETGAVPPKGIYVPGFVHVVSRVDFL